MPHLGRGTPTSSRSTSATKTQYNDVKVVSDRKLSHQRNCYHFTDFYFEALVCYWSQVDAEGLS